MDVRKVLGVWDYTIIALTFLVSMAIGWKFRTTQRKNNSKGYILGGKNMGMLPVVMSISVTMISGAAMIGTPIEMYRYGLQFVIVLLSAPFGVYLVSYIFVPVYFQCEVSSIYEFLEIRYGKTIRYVISALFIIQMAFFMSVVLYAPSLALSAVTHLSLEVSIIACGLVCTFYSSTGGLKAVLWTDVFQSSLMFLCMIAIYIKGISETGISEIFWKSLNSGRLNIFNFTLDLTTRYTFWNVFLRGFIGIMAYMGTSQVEVQRMLSMSTCARAKTALRWSLIPQITLAFMCICLGIVMYAVFYNCDPIMNNEQSGISKYDQIVPYFIVSRFGSVPGLTGLCIAGIFSGSLSSLSSVLNSLSTVTLIDIVKPGCAALGVRLSETRLVYTAKALSIFYGLLCIGLAFTLIQTNSLAAVGSTLMSVMEGPMFAIFLIGVLTRKGTEKNVTVGLVLGVALSSWIAYGSIFSGYEYPSLSLSTDDCPSASNSSLATQNVTDTSSFSSENVFFLYKISFQWLTTIGVISTMVFTCIGILLSGWSHNAIPSDSKCLSPVCQLWTSKKGFSEKKLNEKNGGLELEKLSSPLNRQK